MFKCTPARMTFSMPRAASRLYVSWPRSVIASDSAISMVEICRDQASRIVHLIGQSQPISESSMGRSRSRAESGQHQAVPQRSAVERGYLRPFSLRGVVVKIHDGARGVDDEHAL